MRRLTRAFGDVTTDINPPSTFHFPNEAQYTQALGGAINYAVTWGTDELKSAFTPPAQSSVLGIKALIESTAGGSLGSLIAGQLGSNVPGAVSGMMGQVLDGAIDAVVSGLTSTIVSSIIGMLDVIPVLGQIIGAFVGIIQTICDASGGVQIPPGLEEAVDKSAHDQFAACITSSCQGELDRCSNVRATYYNSDNGSVIKSVADTFRPFAYALHEAKAAPNGSIAIPWCGPMPFVALCGGETEGVYWKNRAEYNSFIQVLRNKYNDQQLGIPQEVQRRLWKFTKAVCQCVNDPRVSATQAPLADAGRSIMPLLVDLTWSFCNDNPRRSAKLKQSLPGHWTVPFLKDLVQFHAPYCTRSANAAGVAATWSGDCIFAGYDIIGDFDKSSGFVKTFSDYDVAIDAHFGTSGGGLASGLANGNTKLRLISIPKTGMVKLSTQAQKDLADHLTGISRLSGAEIAMVAAAAAGGSYLAWELVRMLVKKKNR